MKDTSLSFCTTCFTLFKYSTFFARLQDEKWQKTVKTEVEKPAKCIFLLKELQIFGFLLAAKRSHAALAQSLMLLLVARQEVAKKRAGASPLDPALLRSAAVRAFRWKPSVSKAALTGVIASVPHSRVKKTRENLIETSIFLTLGSTTLCAWLCLSHAREN